MTHMSIQNMNGVGTLMRRRISNPRQLTLSDIVPDEQTPTTDDDLGLNPKGLSPNYAPWWVQPPLKRDEVTTQRGTPTPGELRKAHSEDRFAQPLTPNNDARDLKNSFTGRRLDQWKRRDFPGQFPHTWKPYEDIQTATGPEMGPTPPGWGMMPTPAALRQGAIDAGGNVPWGTEDNMAHDISGFSSLHDVNGMAALSLIVGRRVRAVLSQKLSGMGQFITSYSQLETPAGQAAVNAVTNEATKAAASGADDKTVEQVIQLGAQVAALALQVKYQTTGPVAPKPAPASVIPAFLKSGDNTALYIGGGLALAAAVAVAVAAGRKKGRRR
jgi:hypothetical protein